MFLIWIVYSVLSLFCLLATGALWESGVSHDKYIISVVAAFIGALVGAGIGALLGSIVIGTTMVGLIIYALTAIICCDNADTWPGW